MRRLAKTLSAVLEKFETFCLSAGILLIAALTVLNVLTRTFLDYSLTFVEELCQFFIVLVTFMGTAYAARQGRHIRMSALHDRMGVQNRRRLLALASVKAARRLVAVMAVVSAG